MFQYIPEVCQEIRPLIVDCYWILIVPLCLLMIVFEYFKMPDGQPNGGDVIKRAVVSMILLYSFDECANLMALVADGVTEKINGVSKLGELLNHLGKNYEENSVSWVKFKDAILFVLSICSYIIAYLGVYVADVLIHFVWAVLYICSPLMILMYVSRKTAHVTTNLYKGMLNVVVWKILWSILGVLLLKLATAPQTGDWNNFLTSILVNLCIGTSMLFIPFTAKSLLGDGLSSAASGLATIPTVAASAAVKQAVVGKGKQLMSGTRNLGRDYMEHRREQNNLKSNKGHKL